MTALPASSMDESMPKSTEYKQNYLRQKLIKILKEHNPNYQEPVELKAFDFYYYMKDRFDLIESILKKHKSKEKQLGIVIQSYSVFYIEVGKSLEIISQLIESFKTKNIRDVKKRDIVELLEDLHDIEDSLSNYYKTFADHFGISDEPMSYNIISKLQSPIEIEVFHKKNDHLYAVFTGIPKQEPMKYIYRRIKHLIASKNDKNPEDIRLYFFSGPEVNYSDTRSLEDFLRDYSAFFISKFGLIFKF